MVALGTQEVWTDALSEHTQYIINSRGEYLLLSLGNR